MPRMDKIFILIGPTASGKSHLSLKLSIDFPFEIINADSILFMMSEYWNSKAS